MDKCDICGAEIAGFMFAGTNKQGNKRTIRICFDCVFKRSLEYRESISKKDGERNADGEQEAE